MQNSHYNLILFILVSAILILLMASFIMTILLLYKKKQLSYYKTIEELKLDYPKLSKAHRKELRAIRKLLEK